MLNKYCLLVTWDTCFNFRFGGTQIRFIEGAYFRQCHMSMPMGISLVGLYKRKYSVFSVFACIMGLKLRISNIDVFETKNFAMRINSQKISDLLFKFLQNRNSPIRSCFKSNVCNLSSYEARGSEFGVFWNGKFVIQNSLVRWSSHSNSNKFSLFIANTVRHFEF